MKYVITENQQSIVSGVISSEASAKYAGSYLNQEITLSKDFLEFEHTDGLNLISLDIEYLYPIVSWFDQRFKLNTNLGLGGIWVATKTNVKVFGSGLDNDYHIAGYHLAAKFGPRLEYKNRFFLLCEMKTGYANLRSVLIKNEAPEKANHNVGFIEIYCAIGYNFRL